MEELKIALCSIVSKLRFFAVKETPVIACLSISRKKNVDFHFPFISLLTGKIKIWRWIHRCYSAERRYCRCRNALVGEVSLLSNSNATHVIWLLSIKFWTDNQFIQAEPLIIFTYNTLFLVKQKDWKQWVPRFSCCAREIPVHQRPRAVIWARIGYNYGSA